MSFLLGWTVPKARDGQSQLDELDSDLEVPDVLRSGPPPRTPRCCCLVDVQSRDSGASLSVNGRRSYDRSRYRAIRSLPHNSPHRVDG